MPGKMMAKSVAAVVMAIAGLAGSQVMGFGGGGGGGGPAVVKPVSEEFRKDYALGEGEASVLRWIEPPMPASRREGYLAMSPRGGTSGFLGSGPLMPSGLIVQWPDAGEPTLKGATAVYDRAYSVLRLMRGVLGPGLAHPKAARQIMETEIAGDLVVKAGVKAEEMLVPLSKIVSRALGREVKMEIRTEAAEVYVLSGQFNFKAIDDAVWNEQSRNNPNGPPRRPAESIAHLYVYAQDLGPQVRLPEGAPRSWNRRLNTSSSDVRTLVDVVAERINAPFVIEAKGWPARYAYDDHGNVIEETEAGEVKNTKLILDHLAEQTGLTWKKEVREVRRVVVEGG